MELNKCPYAIVSRSSFKIECCIDKSDCLNYQTPLQCPNYPNQITLTPKSEPK